MQFIISYGKSVTYLVTVNKLNLQCTLLVIRVLDQLCVNYCLESGSEGEREREVSSIGTDILKC